jgi:hypothetical protein
LVVRSSVLCAACQVPADGELDDGGDRVSTDGGAGAPSDGGTALDGGVGFDARATPDQR